MTKTAFITGNSGLVGRSMTKLLVNLGWDVSGCDIKTYNDAHVIFRNHSITTKVDLFVHAAYHVGGRAAIDGVPSNLHRNVHLDSAMFEWAITTKQPRVLYFSSSAAYPVCMQFRLDDTRLNEDDLNIFEPDTPDGNYGWAKLNGERMAHSAREAGLHVTVVRPFSGYDAEQDDTYPFRALLERAHRRENPFTVWGSPHQRRDWIHMDDVCRAALAIVESETTDPVNLCTGHATAIGDLAHLMAEAIDPAYAAELKITPDWTKPQGVLNRVGDPTYMYSFYEPKITIEQGVADAVRSLQ